MSDYEWKDFIQDRSVNVWVQDLFVGLWNRAQQKLVLLALRAQQKPVLLAFRAQQTAQFDLSLMILTIFLKFTCSTNKISNSPHYIHNFWSYKGIQLFVVTVPLKRDEQIEVKRPDAK